MVFPISTIDGTPLTNRMHQLLKYILLIAIIAAQLFGSLAMRNAQCADGGCQCSVQSKSNGDCCCSGNESTTKTCCASKHASSCCDSNNGLHGQAQDRTTICNCGCEDSTQPVPAQSDSSHDELIRILCGSHTAVHFSRVSETTTFESAPQSPSFYGGLSTQPLYCSWLI